MSSSSKLWNKTDQPADTTDNQTTKLHDTEQQFAIDKCVDKYDNSGFTASNENLTDRNENCNFDQSLNMLNGAVNKDSANSPSLRKVLVSRGSDKVEAECEDGNRPPLDNDDSDNSADSADEEDKNDETKLKDNFCKAYKVVFKLLVFHLGPLFFLAIYCALCAALISYLETKYENEQKTEDLVKLNRTIEQILNLTSRAAPEQIEHEDLREILTNYTNRVHEHGRFKKEGRWGYPASLFFTATVVSTIGYGNLTPLSMEGRIFTMVFALFGIPIMLLSVTRCGQGLAKFVSWIKEMAKSRLRKKFKTQCCRRKRKFKEEQKKEFRYAVIVAVVYLILYILGGALIFRIWEEWSLFESFYFCFITMTTIGFGDIEPKHKMFMMACTFYIIIGLALTSMCIELAEIAYLKQMKSIRKTMKKVEGTVVKVGSKVGKVGASVGSAVGSAGAAATTKILDGIKLSSLRHSHSHSDSLETSSHRGSTPDKATDFGSLSATVDASS